MARAAAVEVSSGCSFTPPRAVPAALRCFILCLLLPAVLPCLACSLLCMLLLLPAALLATLQAKPAASHTLLPDGLHSMHYPCGLSQAQACAVILARKDRHGQH